MDLGIKNRVTLVTSGDSGMGLRWAEMLLREGVKVVHCSEGANPRVDGGSVAAI